MKHKTIYRVLTISAILLSLLVTVYRWPTTIRGRPLQPTQQWKYDYDSDKTLPTHEQAWMLDNRGREMHLNCTPGDREYPTFKKIDGRDRTRVRFRCLWWEPYVTKDINWWDLEIEPDPHGEKP